MQQISRSFSFRFIVSCLFFYLFKQPSAYFNRNPYNFANNFLDDDQGVSYPTWLRWTAWPGWMGEGRGLPCVWFSHLLYIRLWRNL
jgi:hypothetical protein